MRRSSFLFTVAMIGSVGCAPPPVTAPSEVVTAHPVATTKDETKTEFEVITVDDHENLFERMAESDLPRGAEVRWENTADGPGRSMRTYFARVLAEPKESPDAVFERAARWSSALALSKSKRIVWERIDDVDAESGRATFVGVRSYFVTGDPILTNADIASAVVRASGEGGAAEVYVAIELRPAAATRFADATDALRQHRVAILLGGRVQSAPVVKSRIAGGLLSITMGVDALDASLERAKALAKALGGPR